MRGRFWLFVALVWAGGGSLVPAVAQQGTGVLPDGKGQELVQAVCSGCHSPRLIAQQDLSRKQWDKTLDWMVDEQGMPELDPATRKTVLDYLAEHLGPDEGRSRPGIGQFNRVQPLRPEMQ